MKFINKLPPNLQVVLGLSIAVGLAVIITLLARSIKAFLKRPDEAEYKAKLALISSVGGGASTSNKSSGSEDPLKGWNPKPLAKSLTTELTTSYYFDASSRCNIFKEVQELSDNQLIAVSNEFIKMNKKSIREMMADTYSDGCLVWKMSEWGEILRTRMTSLGIE